MEGFVCDICGKHLKTAAGLAGHKMLAHPAAKAAASVSPEEGLIELLGAVKEANDGLESEVRGFQAQLGVLSQRLDGFQSSFEAANSAKVSQLEEEVANLKSFEHRREVLNAWLEGMTPEIYYEIGTKLGYQVEFVKATEAEVADAEREEKEEAGENKPGFLAPLVPIFSKGKKEKEGAGEERSEFMEAFVHLFDKKEGG